jgi:hypothetical protein
MTWQHFQQFEKRMSQLIRRGLRSILWCKPVGQRKIAKNHIRLSIPVSGNAAQNATADFA